MADQNDDQSSEQTGRNPNPAGTGSDAQTDARQKRSKQRTGGIRPLDPGSVLGKYEILECLDFGGMGVIYRARHLALDKPVALKVVATMQPSALQAADRFLREMVAIGRVAPHPNVLNAYDAGEEDGIRYIATELIEGIHLGELLKRIGPLSIPEACKIVSQVSLALEHLRKHDLVHRDIKPSNLMLTREGTVKVVDLGLALLRDEQAEQITISGEAMGSIDYMAPEQWHDSHAVDWRSDIYSLGCTFFQLLAGHAPFGDLPRGSMAKMRAHLEREFPDIQTIRPDVPDEVAQVIANMVEKDPSHRLSDLVALADKLDAIAAGDLTSLAVRGFREVRVAGPARLSRGSNEMAIAELSGSADSMASTRSFLIAENAANSPSAPSTARPRWLKRMTIAALLVIAAVWLGDRMIDRGPTGQPAGSHGDADLPDIQPMPVSGTRESPAAHLLHSINAGDAKLYDVTFVPSQNRLATVTGDGTLRVFDLASPEEAAYTVTVSSRVASALDYDPIGDRLAVACEDGSIKVYAAADGRLKWQRQLNGGFSGLAWIPASDMYAVSDWNGTVRLLDLARAETEERLADESAVVYRVKVSSDGKRLVWAGRDSIVSVLDLESRQTQRLSGHQDWIFSVAISPDGQRVASAGREGIVTVWQLPEGTMDAQWKHLVPQTVCFFPDGRHLAIGGRGPTVDIWDVDANERVMELQATQHIDCLAVSPDGAMLAAGSNKGTLMVWRVNLARP